MRRTEAITEIGVDRLLYDETDARARACCGKQEQRGEMRHPSPPSNSGGRMASLGAAFKSPEAFAGSQKISQPIC
jgi:hypothetical protein